MFLIIQRPYIASTVFVVDLYDNTSIIDVWAVETIVIDLEALYYEMMLQELIDAWEALVASAYPDNDDIGIGRDCQDIPSNVIPFGDYRGIRFNM